MQLWICLSFFFFSLFEINPSVCFCILSPLEWRLVDLVRELIIFYRSILHRAMACASRNSARGRRGRVDKADDETDDARVRT